MSGAKDATKAPPEMSLEAAQKVSLKLSELWWHAVSLIAVDASLDDPGGIDISFEGSVPQGICRLVVDTARMENPRAVEVAQATTLLVNHLVRDAWSDVTEDGVSGDSWIGWFDTVATLRVHGGLSLIREGGAWLSSKRETDLTKARCQFIGLILGADSLTGGTDEHL